MGPRSIQSRNTLVLQSLGLERRRCIVIARHATQKSLQLLSASALTGMAAKGDLEASVRSSRGSSVLRKPQRTSRRNRRLLMNLVTSWPKPSSSVPTADDTKLSTYSYGRAYFDYLTREEMEQLHVLFGRAMHRGSTPFTMFQTPGLLTQSA
jgi:hypothetical protein